MAASRVSGRVWSLVRITIPNDLKSVRIRVRKTQNNSLCSYFQREPLGFLMCRSACWHTEKKARFQTLSVTQNGSTAFRFVRWLYSRFFILLYGSILLNTVQKNLQYLGDVKPRVPVMWYQIVRPKSMVSTL